MKVSGISSLELAGPEQISFAIKNSMSEQVAKSNAGAFILPETWSDELEKPSIRVKNPYLAYAITAAMFAETPFIPAGIHATTVRGKDCDIAKEVTIGPFCTIGDRVKIGRKVHIHSGVSIGEDVEIGEESIVYPGVTIYKGCRIGKRVIIHAGAVIGADGFGYAQDGERHVKIPQTGIVRIEDDVEIGANTTIDRAAIGETRIGAGTKIDNLVMVAHNVTTGKACIFVSQTGIAGSVRIGNGVILAGQTGVAGHVTIGDGTIVGSKSGVASSLPAGGTFTGAPAMPHNLFLKVATLLKRLPDMAKDIKTLKKRIERLEQVEDK
jgi:UDP-3-O-[3-hydroxymyristoyl] glucosamine N-acyltransferase